MFLISHLPKLITITAAIDLLPPCMHAMAECWSHGAVGCCRSSYLSQMCWII